MIKGVCRFLMMSSFILLEVVAGAATIMTVMVMR